jgi:hypothetical protein
MKWRKFYLLELLQGNVGVMENIWIRNLLLRKASKRQLLKCPRGYNYWPSSHPLPCSSSLLISWVFFFFIICCRERISLVSSCPFLQKSQGSAK